MNQPVPETTPLPSARRPRPDPALFDWTLLLFALIAVALMLTSFLGGIYSDDILRARFYQSVWYRALVAALCLLTLLCVIRPRRFSWGFTLLHLAPVVLCTAGLLGAFTETRGYLTLRQGETGDRVEPRGDGGIVTLPFQLRLNRFWVENYPAVPRLIAVSGERIVAQAKVAPGAALAAFGARAAVVGFETPPPPPRTGPPKLAYHHPADGAGRLALAWPGEPPELLAAEPGAVHLVPALTAEVTVLATFTDFVIEGGEARNRSDRPDNPAAKVRLRDLATGTTRETWLFARLPGAAAAPPAPPARRLRLRLAGPAAGESREVTLAVDEPLLLSRDAAGARYLVWDEPAGMVKDYHSDLSVLVDGREALRRTAEVNHPLAYGGWLFFQTSYDDKFHSYTVLEALRDPWLPLFYAGALMLALGSALVSFAPRRGGE